MSVAPVGPFVSEIARVGAQRFGDATALVTDTRSMSYRQLWAEVGRVAGWLVEAGLAAGDRVSIYAENRWEWIVSYHGILASGGVVNPLNVMLTPTEVGYATADCGARFVFGSGSKLAGLSQRTCPGVERLVSFDAVYGMVNFADVLEGPYQAHEPRLPSEPTALAAVAYTSGTTGHPKGAMQSHQSIYLNCALTATMHGRASGDVVITALPAPHVYGNVAINSTLLVGGTVRLMERFSAEATLQAVERHRATMVEGVPTMYARMLAEPTAEKWDLSSLTRCTVGGQTIDHSVIEAWEALSGAPLLELWGMTELSGLGTTHAVHAPNVHGSVGVGLPGIGLRIDSVDGDRTDLPANEVGELVVRGPLATLGYYGNPEATAEVTTSDGWLRTGDVALRSADGHVFVVDRVKDVILTGGYNIYPAEVERVITAHSAVAMVGVGGVPDPVKGEIPVAYVVLVPGATASAEDLMAHARAELAPYKLPREVRMVDALPLTSSGKIMRRRLGESWSHR